jgi:CysZ protein
MSGQPAVGQALARAARDLLRGDILWQALWPPLLAMLLWAVVAVFAWQPMSRWLLANLPEWAWLDWLGPWLVHAVLAMFFAPLIYLSTLLLVAVFALPRMMVIVARRDYPDLARHGSAAAAFWGSLANTLTAGSIFLAGWLLCLPLLLIPGGLLILPLLWGAWLNQRTFRYDVLAEHASDTERAALIEGRKAQFWAAGLASALAAHVPVVNLLAPAFGALLFVHVGLSSLRQLRTREGIWVERETSAR